MSDSTTRSVIVGLLFGCFLGNSGAAFVHAPKDFFQAREPQSSLLPLLLDETAQSVVPISPSVQSEGHLLTPMLSAFSEAESAIPNNTQLPSVDPAARVHIQQGYGQLPMYFEPNVGQADEAVHYQARGPGYSLFLTDSEAVLVLRKGDTNSNASTTEADAKGTADSSDNKAPVSHRRALAHRLDPREGSTAAVEAPEKPQAAIVRMRLEGVGHNLKPKVSGVDRQKGISNYYIGNDPAKWHSGVPHFAKVQYKDVYPGIDLVYYGNPQQLEYDFVVAPGADPNQIQLGFEGVDDMRIDSEGNLVLAVAGGEIVQRAPHIYQQLDDRIVDVGGAYMVLGAESLSWRSSPVGEGLKSLAPMLGIRVASYDPLLDLVIDPVMVYSTYLGGSSAEQAHGIAADAAGNAYIVGETSSIDYPTKDGLYTFSGGSDAFVTKLDPEGQGPVYSTYLGGASHDNAHGIAVDPTGNAYVIGQTGSTDFPTVNALYANLRGSYDAFVTKLDPQGQGPVYSTYLGGSENDYGYGVAVDRVGNTYVVGWASIDFPTWNAFQPNSAGAQDAFLSKLDPQGQRLVYSTYLGGSVYDTARAVAVDGAGNVIVVGETNSSDFPTKNAIYSNHLGGSYVDTFVTKLDPQGQGPVYSTYLGGSKDESPSGVVTDAVGNAYVAGATSSTDFPTANALDPTFGGNYDAFVTKLDSHGQGPIYSTYLGGTAADGANGIAVDAAGSVYVAGATYSTDFPTINAIFPTRPGGWDAFVTKLDPPGQELVYSTYLGATGRLYGNGDDMAYGIAVDAAGSAYVTGYNYGGGFPTTNALYPDYAGNYDAFVTKISQFGPLDTYISSISPTLVTVGQPATFVVTGQNLPGTMTFDLPGCGAVTESGPADQRTFTCTPTQTGYQIATITNDQGIQVAGGMWGISVEEVWRDERTPPPDPVVDPPLATGTRHYVIVTHGWNSNAWVWPDILVESICMKLGNITPSFGLAAFDDGVNDFSIYCYAGPPGDENRWFVGAYNWAKDAKGLPSSALANAKKLGKDLADMTFATYTLPGTDISLHLVGHSAGSGLIDNFARETRVLLNGVTIQETFLDGFCPDKEYCFYGSPANWAEQYFDTRDISLGKTDVRLPFAYNFDVTDLDRVTLYSQDILSASHAFPYKYYIATAGGTPPLQFEATPVADPPDPVAAALAAWTQGVEADPIAFIEHQKTTHGLDGASHGPCVLKDEEGLGLSNCTSAKGQPLVTHTSRAPSGQAVDSDCLGQLQGSITWYEGTMIAATCLAPTQAPASADTADVVVTPQPGMLLAQVDLEGPANQLSFDYHFTQPGAAGVIQVFLDGDTLVYVSTQDVDGTDWHSSGRIDISPLAAGTHYLRVVAKSQSAQEAGVEVTHILFEQARNYVADNDFTRDNLADMLWWNPTNRATILGITQPDFTTERQVVGISREGYDLVGVGDFDADGDTDILLYRPTDGVTAQYTMEGGVDTFVPLGISGVGLQVGAIGDVDADGDDDVLWYNPSTGNVLLWKFDPVTKPKPTDLGAFFRTGYEMKGAGDIDGDGDADILWYRPTDGSTFAWLMQEGVVADQRLLGSLPTNLHIAGIGDTDADGDDDILWYDPTLGQVRTWFMQDGVRTEVSITGRINPAFDLVSVIDLDGDGDEDLVFRNPEFGNVHWWPMENGLKTTRLVLGSMNPAFQLIR